MTQAKQFGLNIMMGAVGGLFYALLLSSFWDFGSGSSLHSVGWLFPFVADSLTFLFFSYANP